MPLSPDLLLRLIEMGRNARACGSEVVSTAPTYQLGRFQQASQSMGLTTAGAPPEMPGRSQSLSQWRSIEAAGNERKLLVHANNARQHTAKLSTQYFNEIRMKSTPHHLSHDLAPSDFCFFGYVTKCLAGLSFEDADQLLVALKGVREGLEKVTLQSGLSRVDGPIKEMYCYQWGVY
jgi:hypothetical protein